METPRRRGPGNAVRNWREYDAPFGVKLRMALRNSWTKLRRRANCCGRDGEPGC
jgi:hypothetical protein